MPTNHWIRFLRNYGPIPTNDNMYDETIQRAPVRSKMQPIELPAQHLEWLIENFKLEDPHSIILTGTAGDGKTYHCRRVWLELGGTVEAWNAGEKIQRLSLGSRQLIVVKDLSELRSDESKPLIEQMAWDVADPNSPRVYLMAANHGQLLEKMKTAGSDKTTTALVEVVENLLVVGRGGNAAIKLDLRDLSRSAAAVMIDQVIDAVTQHPGWDGCSDCPALGEETCPIRENRERLMGTSDEWPLQASARQSRRGERTEWRALYYPAGPLTGHEHHPWPSRGEGRTDGLHRRRGPGGRGNRRRPVPIATCSAATSGRAGRRGQSPFVNSICSGSARRPATKWTMCWCMEPMIRHWSRLTGPWCSPTRSMARRRPTALTKAGRKIDETLLPHIAPLGWQHINLTGDYLWSQTPPLDDGGYRQLRRFNALETMAA